LKPSHSTTKSIWLSLFRHGGFVSCFQIEARLMNMAGFVCYLSKGILRLESRG
jgi:hypothetical protein